MVDGGKKQESCAVDSNWRGGIFKGALQDGGFTQ